jgi:hypothetical protein
MRSQAEPGNQGENGNSYTIKLPLFPEHGGNGFADCIQSTEKVFIGMGHSSLGITPTQIKIPVGFFPKISYFFVG